VGFRALRAARTPGISTFLYMHGPSLSGHWYPARRAAATADPGDSSVIEPFFVADLLLLLSPPNAQPSQGAPACIPTPKTLSILANEVIGSPQSLGNRNASFTPTRGITWIGLDPTDEKLVRLVIKNAARFYSAPVDQQAAMAEATSRAFEN
jgi:hypothetical protein